MKNLTRLLLLTVILLLPTGLVSADDPGGTIGPTSTQTGNQD